MFHTTLRFLSHQSLGATITMRTALLLAARILSDCINFPSAIDMRRR